MKTWKLALVGLATVSTSALAVPVVTGSAIATKASAFVIVPDLGGDEITIVTNEATGEVSVQAADGSLVPTTPVSESQVKKVCYGGPCGGPLVYGNGGLGYYGGGYYPPAVETYEQETDVRVRRWSRRTIINPAPVVVPPPVVRPPVVPPPPVVYEGYGAPAYGGPVGPGPEFVPEVVPEYGPGY